MLYKLGWLMVRLRWWVIAFWVLVFIASLPFAPRVTSVLKSGLGDADTESRIAFDMLNRKLDVPESSITLVFSSDDIRASESRYIDEVEKIISPLQDIPEVERVITFYNAPNPNMIAPDGRTTYAFVSMNTGIDESVEIFPRIRESLQSGALDVWATGGIPIFSDLNAASADDLRRAEIITIPIVLVALVLVFGSLIAAGLPIVMGVLSVTVTLAIVYFLGQQTDMSVFVLNIASFLGLGMAIDYSLLLVSRFREELDNHDTNEAVAITCSTAGKAILFSALTSVIGLSGLLFFQFMMLRSLGIGGVTVILFSMIMALTLMPALLAVLGQRVNALPVLPQRVGGGHFWYSLSRWVMKHPVMVIVPVTAFLILLGAPFFGVKLGSPWASILPEEAESRIGWELVSDRFGSGELSPIVLVTTSDTSVLSDENIGAAYDFVKELEKDPRIERVTSIVSIVPGVSKEQYQRLYSSELNGQSIVPGVSLVLDELVGDAQDVSMMQIVSAYHPVSDETKALLKDIRNLEIGGDLQTSATGVTPELVDTVDKMYSDFPKVVIYVAVTTYIALFLLFRSVVLPLKAVTMNILSILASFGALVLVFQQGWFDNLLGFTAEGFTEATVPILLFSIVFGLSMDYEVFLLSRVKEEYEATGDNTHSVAVGMERSGRIITSAALIMILVSAAFATSDILIVKALGFGTALAIFVDATIVRALLVPALMKIMSGLNWWAPRFLKGKPSVRHPVPPLSDSSSD